MSRLRTAAVLAILSMTLSGCVGLPKESVVSTGQAINAANDRDAIAIEPNAPGVNDDPRQIVEGFMQAQISSDNNYAIAREFLTDNAQKSWSPGSSSTVFGSESQMSVTRPDLGTVAFSTPLVGTLNADGRLVRSVGSTSLKFGMTHTSSGWRISSVPANLGVWISRDDFERAYTNVPVYFPARTGSVLVPDPRWLPKLGLTTALARASLSAPSPWLAGTVTSPFPAGSALRVDSVPISSSGIADISITPQALVATAEQKAKMWAVMAATLAGEHGVNGVNITVRGKRLETDNLPSQVRTSNDVGFATPAQAVSSLIVRSGSFSAWSSALAVQAQGGSAENVKDKPVLPAIPSGWKDVAAGQGGRQIAAVSPDGTSLRRWLSGAQLSTARVGRALRHPAFDAQGWLWVAGKSADKSAGDSSKSAEDNHSEMWVMSTAKTTSTPGVRLDIPWLKESVVSFALSPEGDRVAFVLGAGAHSRVVVAGVLRDASGAPSGLGSPFTLVSGVSALSDVVWADALNLAILGTYQGVRQPVLLSLDGNVTGLDAVPGADGLASTLNGGDGLFVHSANHSVYNRLGSAWNSFLSRGEVVVPSS